MLANIKLSPTTNSSNSVIGSRAYTFLDSYIYMKNQKYNAMYEKNKEILAIECNALSLKSANILYNAFTEQCKILDSLIIRVRNFALRIKPDVIENLRLLMPSNSAIDEFLEVISSPADIKRYKYVRYNIKPIKYENMASFMNLYKQEIKYFTDLNTQTMNKEDPFIRNKAAAYLINTAYEHANLNTELLEMENIKIINPAKLKSIYTFFKRKNTYITTVNQDFKTFIFYLRQYSGLRDIITSMRPTETRNELISLNISSGKQITFNDYFVLYKHFSSMIKYMIKIIGYHEQQFFNKIYALQNNIESYVSILNDVLDNAKNRDEDNEESLHETFEDVYSLVNGNDQAKQLLNDTAVSKPCHVKAIFTSEDFNKYRNEISPLDELDDEDNDFIASDSIDGVTDGDISNFEEYDENPGEVSSICTLRNSLNV